MQLARFTNGSMGFYLSCSLKALLSWRDTAVRVNSEEARDSEGM